MDSPSGLRASAEPGGAHGGDESPWMASFRKTRIRQTRAVQESVQNVQNQGGAQIVMAVGSG